MANCTNLEVIANLTATVSQLSAALDQANVDYSETLDTIWMLMASALVFFMHAGFSLLEAGCVRVKNTQNILAKNLLVVTVGFLSWYFVGYAFAFGATSSPNLFAGSTSFVMDGFAESKDKFRFWLFQGAFCATGATIVSGAMAERTQLKGFAIYLIMMSSVIYPIVVYWGWSGQGLLFYDGDKSVVGPSLMDFAGSGLVHMVGGVGALVGAIAVGPRLGRWDESLADEFEAHSIPFCVLGTFFLWFGWYGFNPGSTLTMHDRAAAYTAGLVAVNTTLSPCVAGLVVFWLRATLVSPKLLDVGGFCNGILAGLVAVTAGCAVVQPWEAILIGFFSGFVYQGTSMLMRRLKVDDVVDAFAVHGANGFLGLVAPGLFGSPGAGFPVAGNGAFHGAGGAQLGTQLLAAFLITVWVGTLSVLIMVPLRFVGWLRLGDDFQDKGADAMEHTPTKAYATQSP